MGSLGSNATYLTAESGQNTPIVSHLFDHVSWPIYYDAVENESQCMIKEKQKHHKPRAYIL